MCSFNFKFEIKHIEINETIFIHLHVLYTIDLECSAPSVRAVYMRAPDDGLRRYTCRYSHPGLRDIIKTKVSSTKNEPFVNFF